MNNEELDTESRIIEAAKALFIEKGYTETSMSDIATRVGMNRPALHYYFRTKDRMFDAVFGSIISVLAPKIVGILTQKQLPIAERIGAIVNAYYEVFRRQPALPLFMLKEAQRDVNFVVGTIRRSPAFSNAETIVRSLTDEMQAGRIRTVPLRYLFLTFFGLLTVPFTTKPLCETLMLEDNETYDDLIEGWKPFLRNQLSHLLIPQPHDPS